MGMHHDPGRHVLLAGMEAVLSRLGADLARIVARFLKPGPEHLRHEVTRRTLLSESPRVALSLSWDKRTRLIVNRSQRGINGVVIDNEGTMSDAKLLRSEGDVAAFCQIRVPSNVVLKFFLCDYVMNAEKKIVHMRVRAWRFRRDADRLGRVMAEVVRLRIGA